MGCRLGYTGQAPAKPFLELDFSKGYGGLHNRGYFKAFVVANIVPLDGNAVCGSNFGADHRSTFSSRDLIKDGVGVIIDTHRGFFYNLPTRLSFRLSLRCNVALP